MNHVNPSKLDRIIIDRLTVDGLLGIYDVEKTTPQPIVISLSCGYYARAFDANDVICYKDLSDRVTELVQAAHTHYAEELAEKIAILCLSDSRVVDVMVRVEKPDAIHNVKGVGVEIHRNRSAK